MNNNLTQSSHPAVSRPSASTRLGSLMSILLVSLPLVIVVLLDDVLGTDVSASAAIVINLAYLLAILIATFVFKAQGRGWRDLGLGRPESWLKTIGLALGTFLAMVAVLVLIQVIMANIPGQALPPSDQSDYNPLAGNLPMLLTMIAAAWTVVAFGEEMIFRAFLIHALGGVFGNIKARWALALAGSSLLFGLAHSDWGVAGVIETFIAGLIFGTVYLRSGRNLWVPIIAHGLINTLKFSLIYAGWV
jgi:membrane protease YdiL (CAAX protease family)